MKIYVIKADFSILLGKNYLFLFSQHNTQEMSKPGRKIKLVGFPASCKVSSQQAEKRRQFSTVVVPQNGCGKMPQI